MLKKKLISLSVLLSGLAGFSSFTIDVNAEPWLGSRFAQNCAGCHSPQRLNVAPKGRRCSLSCQGCHTNPNGGGLRSTYGKWNGNRWLKSFRSTKMSHKKNIAPFTMQNYAKFPYQPGVASKELITGRGVPLVEQDSVMDEPLYSRRYGKEKIIASDRQEYLYEIPEGDPWRQMSQSKFNAGADARWFMASGQAETNGKSSDVTVAPFLMSIDYGLEYRPFYRKLHLVYESRIFGSPNKDRSAEQTLTSSVATRSMYALVDDLPWNTFVMAGYYRPLFGNQVPNHMALAQKMQSFILSGSSAAQRLAYNTVSIGTAPNVPYFNLHIISKRVGDSDDRTRGVATNFGLRFVTLGLSLNYSFWRTEDRRKDQGLTAVGMHSIGLNLSYKRTTATYEAVSFTRDSDEDFREGGIHTLDTYTRVWREIYFLLNFARANTTAAVTTGGATQYQTGIRAFLFPGMDFSLLYGADSSRDSLTEQQSKRTGVSSQMHLYF